MNTVKYILPLFYLVLQFQCQSQYKIEPTEGFSPQIGVMVDMLEEMKEGIEEQVQDLSQSQTDYLIDDKANSIGQLLMHLVSTEAYYQVETLEERGWTEAESELYNLGGELGDESRKELVGKPISHYLQLWDEVRIKSLEGLKNRDDDWFAAEVEEGINYHWVWFHVLEHSAQHMGQIALILNKMDD